MSFRICLLIAALGLATTPTSAQELSDQPVQQSVDGNEQGADQNEAAPPGFPVRIVQGPAQSESAKREQREAEQREINDLKAQQLSAESTRKAYYVGVAQAVLAAVGAIGLVYSLFLNRTATKAAVDAVAISRSVGQKQVRAYVGLKVEALGKMDDFVLGKSPTLKAFVKNSGASPAFDMTYWGLLMVDASDDIAILHDANLPPEDWTRSILPPSGEIGIVIKANFQIDSDLLSGARGLQPDRYVYAVGQVRYRDVFNVWHFANFSFRRTPFAVDEQQRTGWRWTLTKKGNEAD